MSVTLTDLHSLDDLRNDPDEYARFLMERKKKQREEEKDPHELWSYQEERKREDEEKSRIAKQNSEDNKYGWAGLPLVVLTRMMDHLTFRDRLRASQVCKTWYWTFHSPNIWRELVLEETSFVRTSSIVIRSDSGFGSCIKKTVKTGPHKGWLNSIGEYIKSIRLTSMDDYGIMSGHCAILTRLIKICREELGYYPLPRLKRFSFTFNPAFLEGETISLYLGTGGNIMHSINSLVNSFTGLEDVSINDLLLETMEETTNLILGLIDCCGTTIRRLQLLNLTRDPLSICCFVFTRLHTLVVSPPQITTEMVVNFGEAASLRKVHIVQDKFSSIGPSIEASTWDDVKEKNPYFRVRLQINADLKEDIIIQPHAPVSEIIYNSKYTKINSTTICEIVDNYSKTLNLYAHTSLPRFYGSKNFHERCDSSLIMLVRNCLQLKKLVIRERVSTATLLLIASRCKHVKTLVVRRNCVVKRCEWPKNVAWTDVWYDWLRYASRCYDRTLNDIRDLMRQPGWNWLSDFEFSIFDLSTITDEKCGLSPANAFIDVDQTKIRFRTESDLVESSLDYCDD